VIADPIEQGALEADVATGLLGLNPFMTKDFLTLRQELLVKAGALNEIFATFVRG
jgi:hypothetical protein